MLTYRSLHREKRHEWWRVSPQARIWLTTWRGTAAIKGRVANVPWRPLLSKKLLRLNSVFLEARYCINLCKGREVNEERFNFELRLLTKVHLQTMLAWKMLWTQRLIYWFVFFLKNKSVALQPWPRCRRPSDGAWWWVTWRQPPSSCWWSSQTVCQPAVGCSHSFRLCSGSNLRRKGCGKEGSRRWINATDKWFHCPEEIFCMWLPHAYCRKNMLSQ